MAEGEANIVVEELKEDAKVAEKKADVATAKLDKELAKSDDKVIADLQDVNVIQVVVGSVIGFFVWFGLTKLTGVDPEPSTKPVEVVLITDTPTCEPPSIAIEPEDKGIAPQINNQITSFW